MDVAAAATQRGTLARRERFQLVSFVVAAKESFGGMRLLRRADFNAGANINTFWRMPCRGALDGSSKKALTWDNKHITWFGRSRLQRER